MENQAYKNQVSLLLSVIPEVAKEKCFALHGGTAINLFIREMPRLSVDIDFTYIPIENRQTSLKNISQALERIQGNVLKAIPNSSVNLQKDVSKLQISLPNAQIKLEVNQTNRGVLEKPPILSLCEYAQNEFDVFCQIQTVHYGQLYGGKICAALDRQHPRDVFDVRYLLDNEGFSEDIKKGFLLCLLSSNRPISELLKPNLLDQRETMLNQFEGMSRETFSYEEFEKTREELIITISKALTDKDKDFIIRFENNQPMWSIYDFESFPSVQWKLYNLEQLKSNNPDKHEQYLNRLKEILSH